MFSRSSKGHVEKQLNKSRKWITATKQVNGRCVLNVDDSVSENLFKPLGSSLIGLISIFGAARQGKSFLMNCLAGETDLFRISNERESCTQGIDISEHLLDLTTFSGDKKLSPRGGMKVGFIDAEGQGDKDVSYDANLVCPILLASKCVIFNWKDSMQKDRILQLLGVMHKAAINVAEEGDISTSSTCTSIFGHLHVVFRDWQYVDSTPESVKNDIFNPERSADNDARMRNAIRMDIKDSFQSITVWLMPPPVASSEKLSSKLRVEDTSDAFRTQLGALKNKLAAQLMEPMKFAGRPFTGNTIGPLLSQVVDSLNSGDAVKPMSAYASMIRCELDKKRLRTEESIREVLKEIVASLESLQLLPAEVDQLPSEKSILSEYSSAIKDIVDEFAQDVNDAVGSFSGDVSAQIASDCRASIENVKQSGVDQLRSLYKSLVADWTDMIKTAIEERLENDVKELQKEFPLKESALLSRLNNVFDSAVALLNKREVQDSLGEQRSSDMKKQLKRHFEARVEGCKATNALQEKQSVSKVESLVEAAKEKMEAYVEERTVAYESRCIGYDLKEFMSELNGKYSSVESTMTKAIETEMKKKDPEVIARSIEALTAFCEILSKSIDEKYRVTLQKVYDDTTDSVIGELEVLLSSTDVSKEERTLECVERTYQSALARLKGWAQPKAKLDTLNATLATHAVEYVRKQLALEEEERRQAELKQDEDSARLADERVTSNKKRKTTVLKKSLVEVEDPEEEGVPMEVVERVGRASLSVGEQRARAKAWAEKEDNVNNSKNKTAVISDPLKKGSSRAEAIAEATRQARLEHEQRADEVSKALLDHGADESSGSKARGRRMSTAGTPKSSSKR